MHRRPDPDPWPKLAFATYFVCLAVIVLYCMYSGG